MRKGAQQFLNPFHIEGIYRDLMTYEDLNLIEMFRTHLGDDLNKIRGEIKQAEYKTHEVELCMFVSYIVDRKASDMEKRKSIWDSL